MRDMDKEIIIVLGIYANLRYHRGETAQASGKPWRDYFWLKLFNIDTFPFSFFFLRQY